jgi:hypothetical protein
VQIQHQLKAAHVLKRKFKWFWHMKKPYLLRLKRRKLYVLFNKIAVFMIHILSLGKSDKTVKISLDSRVPTSKKYRFLEWISTWYFHMILDLFILCCHEVPQTVLILTWNIRYSTIYSMLVIHYAIIIGLYARYFFLNFEENSQNKLSNCYF